MRDVLIPKQRTVNMSNYMTIEEAAKKFGCTKSNIYQLIKTHKLETVTKIVIREQTGTRRVKVQHIDYEQLESIYE